MYGVGVLINNPPAVQFPYKFKFILCKNWGTSCKDIKTLNCLSSTQYFEVFSLEQFGIKAFILL